jgi:hypothetical protein
MDQRLLLGQDLGFLCLSDQLDYVALLGVTLPVDERIQKTRSSAASTAPSCF